MLTSSEAQLPPSLTTTATDAAVATIIYAYYHSTSFVFGAYHRPASLRFPHMHTQLFK
jgi:hypothetical protein